MKVRIDEEDDALYITISEEPIKESEEVSPGVILDFNESGKIVGIEILEYKERLSLKGGELKLEPAGI